MSDINRKALIAVGIGAFILGALVVSAGPAAATEKKPCKEHPTTTTTVKPKPKHHATTTTTAKPKSTIATVAPTTTTTKPKAQTVAYKPIASTTTTTAKPVEVETQVLAYETAADDSINRPAESTTELAHTGARTTFLALLGAALTGIGMVILRVRSALAR
jgi:LPXTG-motif cell wall-anchored protein